MWHAKNLWRIIAENFPKCGKAYTSAERTLNRINPKNSTCLTHPYQNIEDRNGIKIFKASRKMTVSTGNNDFIIPDFRETKSSSMKFLKY